MQFSKLAEYMGRLEGTTKRLEMTEILSELIDELPVDEIDLGLYLSLGYLRAPFNSEKFNIAEKMMMSALESAYGASRKIIETMYSEEGDLGDVAKVLYRDKAKMKGDVAEIHRKLLEIALYEGSGSQEKKISGTSELLKEADPNSAKFLVRIILGNTRLGFTELTIIDALSNFISGDKSLKKKIEKKYNVHPDIGLIAKKIKEKGMEGLEDVSIEVGVPVLPQKAQRLGNPQEIIEKLGKVWAEYKFDGTRVQLHMDRNRKTDIKTAEQQELFGGKEERIFIKTFTRNLDETTHQYPDIIKAAEEQIGADSVILDGEALGYDKDTGEFLPFQETIQRKRKHGIGSAVKDIPLKYIVFDIIYLDGKLLMFEPLEKRRAALNSIVKEGEVIKVDEHLMTQDADELSDYFLEAKGKKLEGLLVKNPDSEYEAGARAYSWVKLKRTEEEELQDTVDVTVLGYYYGRGERAKFGIGGFLVAVYDDEDDTFKTVSKVGSGLTDEEWVVMKEKLDDLKVDNKPANVEAKKELYPDVWADPKLVVVIKADEISKSPQHTAGFALRFPRLERFREDKKPQDSTTVKEVEELYNI